MQIVMESVGKTCTILMKFRQLRWPRHYDTSPPFIKLHNY